MNSLITFMTIVLLLFSVSSIGQQSDNELGVTKIDELYKDGAITLQDELYTLKFRIEKTENNTYNLIVAIKLHKGSMFISPHEKKEFSGKFFMDLGSYDHLSFDGKIMETPPSASIFEQFSNETVLWVKENTTYTQPLKIQTESNFEVFGRLKFTIEPRCTLEEIPFAISYKDGVMTIIPPKC